MIIDKIAGKINEMDLEDSNIHTVEFTEDQMAKGHQRFTTKDGYEAAISFGPGQSLEDGNVLYAGNKEYILVRAAEEDVFVIKPEGNKEWGKTCYNIGNMHKKAYFCNREILVPYDAILEQILKKLNVDYSREKRRIIGERANISSREHAHVHEQEHHHHK